jgi:TRAP-type C4-dicarboxylate transport system permease large subunit
MWLAAVLATTFTWLLPAAAGAQDKPIELKFSSWVSAVHGHHTGVMVPWVKMVEEKSGGRLKITIFPGSTLGKAVATPTEVGALGAFLAGLIGAAFGRLSLAGALEAIRQTIKTSALIFMILIGATIFGYYMAMSKIPQQIVAMVTEMNLNRWVVIVGIVVAYFVISMFIDELPLLLLTLQLTFPLITSLGFDPIWFGVLSMLMLSMGLVFPPVGMIAFVVASSANVSLVKVYTGTSILMIALVLTTVLLMVFPQIALWLPATMK